MGSQHSDTQGRNAQLVRLLHILRDLDRLGGVDLYELSERYGTTVRTIRRDLEALQEAGLPLTEEQDGKRKRWRVTFKDRLQALTNLLDASHYLALRLAMGQGGAVRSTTLAFATLEDLSKKIETAVGTKGRAQLAAIEACFHSYEKFAYERSAPEVLWPLIEAISLKRLCRITYRAPSRKPVDKTFDILPLRLFLHDGAVHLMCSVPKHESIVTLNLQRLRALQVLDKRAEPPKGFDPSSLEDSAFGIYRGSEPVTYVLHFNADTAPYIRERVWHPTQGLTDLGGGGVELRFTCGASYEVTAWVASWRHGVEVVLPEGLRAELAELGRKLVERYGKPDARGPALAAARTIKTAIRRRPARRGSPRRSTT